MGLRRLWQWRGGLAVDTVLGARLDGVAHGLGVGLQEEVVVVEVGEVVVVEDFLESEAAGTDFGDGGGSEVELELEGTEVGDGRGSRTAGANVGCWVLWAMNLRVRVRASGVCARLPWRPVCEQVLVPWVVSCVPCGGVVQLF